MLFVFPPPTIHFIQRLPREYLAKRFFLLIKYCLQSLQVLPRYYFKKVISSDHHQITRIHRKTN